jgi:hypothetical protein
VLSAGPVLDMVIAAASIPGVLPPVAVGGRRLIDGGVVNNTPISHSVELGAGRIYVLPTQDPANPWTDYAPRTAVEVAICGVRLLIDSRLDADVARYAAETELIVLPAPNTGHVQPTNFEHAGRLMNDARVAARMALARREVESPPRLAGDGRATPRAASLCPGPRRRCTTLSASEDTDHGDQGRTRVRRAMSRILSDAAGATHQGSAQRPFGVGEENRTPTHSLRAERPAGNCVLGCARPRRVSHRRSLVRGWRLS